MLSRDTYKERQKKKRKKEKERERASEREVGGVEGSELEMEIHWRRSTCISSGAYIRIRLLIAPRINTVPRIRAEYCVFAKSAHESAREA